MPGGDGTGPDGQGPVAGRGICQVEMEQDQMDKDL